MSQETRQPFGVRLLPSVKEAGDRAAADDNRSLGSLMEKLLIDHLKANGYLPGGNSKRAKAKG